MFARMHMMGGDAILAVCDEDILGKTLSDERRKITVAESFFKGSVVEEEVLVEWMKSAASMNIIGNEAVDLAVREGYADPDQAFEIGGVKYLVVVVM